VNTDQVGDLPTAIYASRARSAGCIALAKADDFLAQLTDRQGIDRVVDRLATDVRVFKIREFHGTELASNC